MQTVLIPIVVCHWVEVSDSTMYHVVRASLGFMTTVEDVVALIEFVKEYIDYSLV